jgi:anion-transporting  ArsA/GET3 family ATPase
MPRRQAADFTYGSTTEVLGKRVVDRGVDHAHLQLERLMPALRIVGEAIRRGELKAVAPLIKVIDRLDKHQNTVVAKYSYGPEERQRLLDKINRIANNLQPADGGAAEPTGEDGENNSNEIPV